MHFLRKICRKLLPLHDKHIFQDIIFIMGIFNKLFHKKETEAKTGGMEDYMTLVRVYFQASVAANLGINKEFYKTDDLFFKEIDQSIRKNCRKVTDVQTYMFQFQGFSQDLMMLTGNLMKYKLRLPSFMKRALYTMTEKTVNDIFLKNDYTDAGVIKAVLAIRKYNNRLGFSQKWVTDFVYQVVMLAKKEPKPADAKE